MKKVAVTASNAPTLEKGAVLTRVDKTYTPSPTTTTTTKNVGASAPTLSKFSSIFSPPQKNGRSSTRSNKGRSGSPRRCKSPVQQRTSINTTPSSTTANSSPSAYNDDYGLPVSPISPPVVNKNGKTETTRPITDTPSYDKMDARQQPITLPLTKSRNDAASTNGRPKQPAPAVPPKPTATTAPGSEIVSSGALRTIFHAVSPSTEPVKQPSRDYQASHDHYKTSEQSSTSFSEKQYMSSTLFQRFSPSNYNFGDKKKPLKEDKLGKTFGDTIPPPDDSPKADINYEGRQPDLIKNEEPQKPIRGVRVLPMDRFNSPNGTKFGVGLRPVNGNTKFTGIEPKSGNGKPSKPYETDGNSKPLNSSTPKKDDFCAADAVADILTASKQPMSLRIQIQKHKTETSYTRGKSVSPPTRDSNGRLFRESCL